jgi:anti-anti-sigma regulatory factor
LSFFIIISDSGVIRLHLEGELEDAKTRILRGELASLLRRRPTRVDLSLSGPDLFDDTIRGMLLSFFELLRAHGGRLHLSERGGPRVAVVEARQLEHLLKAAPASAAG